MGRHEIPRNQYIKRLTPRQLECLCVLLRAKGEWVNAGDKDGTQRLEGYGYAESKPRKGGDPKLHRITAEGKKRLLDPEKMIPEEEDDGN